MYQPSDLDYRLEHIAGRDFTSVADALASLIEATSAINAELTRVEPSALFGGDDERVRRWIERLRGLASRVARESRGAGYSISVGLPAGVAVAISWSVESASTKSIVG